MSLYQLMLGSGLSEGPSSDPNTSCRVLYAAPPLPPLLPPPYFLSPSYSRIYYGSEVSTTGGEPEAEVGEGDCSSTSHMEDFGSSITACARARSAERSDSVQEIRIVESVRGRSEPRYLKLAKRQSSINSSSGIPDSYTTTMTPTTSQLTECMSSSVPYECLSITTERRTLNY